MIQLAGYPSWNPEDCEFCLSTGLKDKNGKEIFEGDILRLSYEQSVNPCGGGGRITVTEKTLWEVYWYGGWARWDLQNGDDAYDNGDYHRGDDLPRYHDVTKIEVVGNKFENPELLEKGLEHGAQKQSEEGEAETED